MRSLIIAAVLAAGFGLMATGSTVASPANSIVTKPMSTPSPVSEARCWVRCHHSWYSRRRCHRRCW